MKLRNVLGVAMGSKNPSLVYIAFRSNGKPLPAKHEWKFQERISRSLRMLKSNRLEVKKEEVRIYNLLPPKRNQGMKVRPGELRRLVASLSRIVSELKSCQRLRRVVIGGISGPMPMAGAFLKTLLGRTRVEIRRHHSARGKRLALVHAF